jgi:hypothetical protein
MCPDCKRAHWWMRQNLYIGCSCGHTLSRTRKEANAAIETDRVT